MDSTVRISEARNGREVLPPLTHHDAIMSVSFSPDGAKLLSASLDGTARLWRVRDAALLAEASSHAEGVSSAQFNSNGNLFATGCWDGRVRFWDAATGRPVSECLSEDHVRLTGVGFSPDGRWLAAASQGSTLRLWPVPALTAPAPEWLSALAEALAGCRQLPDGHVEPVPATALLELRERLQKLPGDGPYARWARRFFGGPGGYLEKGL